MIPLAYNVRSLLARRRTALAAALGVALVVFVLSSALMLAQGVRRAMGLAGRADTAIVLRRGSDAELGSVIDVRNVGLVLAAPGVAASADGAPLGAGEVIVVAAMNKVGAEGHVANVQIRGVPDGAAALRPELRVVKGRPPRPGTAEAMIGARLRGRFPGLELGQSFELKKDRAAAVVGVFEAAGAAYESEIWVDADVLRAAFGREGMVSSVRVRLSSPAAFDGFAASVGSDKRLGLLALRESEFYQRQSEGTSIFVTALGVVIAVLCSLGAMIGAMITMYASVAERRREIGVLRALGFSRLGILSSFLIESALLALAGGVIGAAASLAMGLVRFSMMNFASWSEIVFTFTPTPAILAVALVAAVGMGLVGGLLPALRAARVSPVAAMRG